jgi:CRISPR-associated endoribonuclease Cas6
LHLSSFVLSKILKTGLRKGKVLKTNAIDIPKIRHVLRVLVRLVASSSFPYDLGYHHNLQAFIYTLTRGTEYSGLHDQDGCRFFSFSNLIPPSPIVKKGSERSLIIASPDNHFIETLSKRLYQLSGREVRIGSMTFTVKGVRLFDLALPEDDFREFTLTSGTPIIVRIPRYRYEEYGIEPKKNYEYAYWRKEYTPTAFLKQVEENLTKKYGEYAGKQPEPNPIFDRLRFKKEVAIPIQMKGKESTVIGTLWEFHLQASNGQIRDILQLGLDAGFGEMNSLGFGFMNIAEHDR